MSMTRDYIYPWKNVWFETLCDPSISRPAGPGPVAAGGRRHRNAATVNLFVMHNRMHDWAYNLGFNEENWNSQASNFGNSRRAGRTTRRRRAAVPAQSAAADRPRRTPAATTRTCSAARRRLVDHEHVPLAAARRRVLRACVDGDYDMAVIGHEYGHMIENRMIGKGGIRPATTPARWASPTAT